AVTVWLMPAVVLVVNETVAAPLALVGLVGGVNDPPFVLLHVTVCTPATGLLFASASCAVIVTAVPAAALEAPGVAKYFAAVPALVRIAPDVPVTFPTVPVTACVMPAVVLVVNCTVAVPALFVVLVGVPKLLPLVFPPHATVWFGTGLPCASETWAVM